MKLDLLYEIDVPKPWNDGPHPYGQRIAEQRAYKETIEQIKLADKLGFHTTWHVEHHFREGRCHSPAPEVIIGALSQCTENIRLGFGVTLMPHAFTPPMRVAEKVATADILSGGRVEWGTGRSTPMEQTAFGVDRDASKEMAGGDPGRRRDVGERSTSSSTASTSTSRAAWSRPSPCRTRTRRAGWRRRRTAVRRWPARSASAC